MLLGPWKGTASLPCGQQASSHGRGLVLVRGGRPRAERTAAACPMAAFTATTGREAQPGGQRCRALAPGCGPQGGLLAGGDVGRLRRLAGGAGALGGRHGSHLSLLRLLLPPAPAQAPQPKGGPTALHHCRQRVRAAHGQGVGLGQGPGQYEAAEGVLCGRGGAVHSPPSAPAQWGSMHTTWGFPPQSRALPLVQACTHTSTPLTPAADSLLVGDTRSMAWLCMLRTTSSSAESPPPTRTVT